MSQPSPFNEAIRQAAENNNVNAVAQLIQQGASDADIESALLSAATHGARNVVAYLLDTQKINSNVIDWVPFFAAGEGQRQLVRDLIQHRIGDLNGALYEAVRYNHPDIVTDLIQGGVEDLNGGLSVAAHVGNRPMIDLLLNSGATELNRALSEAAASGHYDLMNYLLSRGANNLNLALYLSAFAGNLESIKRLVQMGATNLKEARNEAADEGHPEIVTYLDQVIHQSSSNGRYYRRY
jgi:ankyrin repeat protein